MYPAKSLALETLGLLQPPPQVKLSEWAERYFFLPEGSSARPGRFRPWPYQRGILDAMGDPLVERVTVKKAARVGYTKCLMAKMGGTADLDPCSIILLVPTDEDARGFAVDEVEPSFEESPRLRGLIRLGRIDGRNTLTMKTIAGGGSIKILAARSPRNLRRHDAKVLLVDEEDAMEVTKEGAPVPLAEKRTLAHPDRKIVRGSTPTDETSSIEGAYAESDQRVYEVPCPNCGATFQILWKHIVWPKGAPEKAVCFCPHCFDMANRERPVGDDIFADRPKIIIAERFKSQMVMNGEWVARRPDIKGHAGFHLNTFISLHANASWPKLAEEYEKAKRGGPAALQVFRNTVEGEVWKTSLDNIDDAALASRVEDFGIKPGENGRNRFPVEVVLVVAGVDTQDDRFEIILWGFSETEAFFLDHHVIFGDPADSVTQAELDAFLKTTWPHPNGWTIGIESVAIDSQGHKTNAVYDFCRPRLGRRIYPIISRVGSRKVWEPAKKRPDGVRLFIVGHDQIKTLVLQHLAIPPLDEAGQPSPGRCRYSADLEPESFDQLTGEHRVIRYVKNRVVAEFRPKQAGQRVEALDGTCYAWAVKTSMRVNWAERRARAGGIEKDKPSSLAEIAARLNK